MKLIKDATEEDYRALFSTCYDVKFENHNGSVFMYCEGMADTKQLNEHIVPRFGEMIAGDELKRIDENQSLFQIEQSIFSGNAIIYYRGDQQVYEAHISKLPQRQPEESANEVSIRGPRDGFTEELATNVALVRKRLRTASLQYEHFLVGKRSHANLALLYVKDIINPAFVAEARHRIKQIDVDAVVGSAQLEEYFSDSSDSIFPLVDYIGRPDYTVEALLRGRFVILADGFPIATIGPSSISEQLKSVEDVHTPYYYTIFQRLLRLFGLLISMLLPGFYIALTSYNIDQLPFPLLASIAESRAGIPYPAPLEVVFILGLFELFREASIRLPKAVSQTVTVVGGLIIGDAAISSGLSSPAMLMVTAITAVASFSLVNQSLTGTVTIIRIYILLLSSLLGIYGFFIGLFSVVAYTSTLTSFGISYWAPIGELNVKSSILAIINRPFKSKKVRPSMLQPNDNTGQEG